MKKIQLLALVCLSYMGDTQVMLVWSADRFVDGAARTASYFKVPPMLIGMLVVGFGTSAHYEIGRASCRERV